MLFFVVAKSRDGWGVAAGSDLVREFADARDAVAYAEELRALAESTGGEAEVVDLTDVELPGTLLPREP